MWIPPASRKASMTLNASSSGVSLPKYMVPSAMRDTAVPVLPRVRYSMVVALLLRSWWFRRILTLVDGLPDGFPRDRLGETLLLFARGRVRGTGATSTAVTTSSFRATDMPANEGRLPYWPFAV
jgi:hypothetical protein